MKRSKVFLINAVILSASSIVVQAIEVWYKVYITNIAGTQAMGLFQLIMSVYSFALTLALSGINLAATRLVAEEIGSNDGNVKLAVKNSLIYSLTFGFVSAILLFCFSNLIANYILMNSQTELSLKLLTSVFNGYFNAVRRVVKSSVTTILDQVFKTVIALFIFTQIEFKSISSACVGIVLSIVLAEILSFIFAVILFIIDRKKHEKNACKQNNNITKRMLNIALPIAFSTYVRSGLLSIEHLLIPISLRKHGSSYGQALSVYGIIHGIVLPLLLFPSAIISSFSGLLIPEISENLARKGKISEKNKKHSVTDLRTNYIIRRVYQITFTLSIPICVVFIFFAEKIAILASSNSPDTVFYLKLLALMIPIMYLDSVTDSFLKALNEQLSSMLYNIFDSAICVILVVVLLPVWGIKGYICVLYLSEIFNATLSVLRLVKVANFKFDLSHWVVFPVLTSVLTALLLKLGLSIIGDIYSPIGIIALFIVFSVIYFCILFVTKTITMEDINWFKSIFQKESKCLTKKYDVGNI